MAKQFIKVLGKTSLYMICLTAVAVICSLIQTMFKKYEGRYNSFIFSGSNYRYNYFMYVVGIIIFIVSMVLLYKKFFEKDFKNILELNIPLKILIWIVLMIWGVLMAVATVIVLFALVSGLTINLLPEALEYVSIFCWPVIAIMYIAYQLFTSVRDSK